MVAKRSGKATPWCWHWEWNNRSELGCHGWQHAGHGGFGCSTTMCAAQPVWNEG